MKKRIPGFLAGMVTMAVIGGVTVTALAAAGSFTITVDPVNIQVNGQVFAPKDVKGNNVPVFAYNGTTYAPLRALAEAYGLNVGYDGTSNMATVTGSTTPSTPSTEPSVPPIDPNHAPTVTVDELKAMFKFDNMFTLNGNDEHSFMYSGEKTIAEFNEYWSTLNQDDVEVAMTAWAKDFYGSEYKGDKTISIMLNAKSAMGTTMMYARIYFSPTDGTSNFRFNK